MSPRTLKLIALGYVVKTLLFGVAWLVVPDLPTRAANKARQTWAAMLAATQRDPSAADAAAATEP